MCMQTKCFLCVYILDANKEVPRSNAIAASSTIFSINSLHVGISSINPIACPALQTASLDLPSKARGTSAGQLLWSGGAAGQHYRYR